jgi:hypothetical protein
MRAVAASELEEFLDRLGLLGDVKGGMLKCGACGQAISLANLGCVYPVGEEIRVVCHAQACYRLAPGTQDAT